MRLFGRNLCSEWNDRRGAVDSAAAAVRGCPGAGSWNTGNTAELAVLQHGCTAWHGNQFAAGGRTSNRLPQGTIFWTGLLKKSRLQTRQKRKKRNVGFPNSCRGFLDRGPLKKPKRQAGKETKEWMPIALLAACATAGPPTNTAQLGRLGGSQNAAAALAAELGQLLYLTA